MSEQDYRDVTLGASTIVAAAGLVVLLATYVWIGSLVYGILGRLPSIGSGFGSAPL